MKRRIFTALLGAAITPAPFVQAQPRIKQARIGFIEPGTREANGQFLTSFRTGMAARGWIEGQNLTILDRWVENRPERLPQIVAGLLADKVDVLVAGGTIVTKATLLAAPGVPIVMVGVSDPLSSGFAQSLARPGG